MRIQNTLCITCLLALFSSACAPAVHTQTPYQPGFFYLSLSPGTTLEIADQPGAAIKKHIPLEPPAGCTLYALRPAPKGPWIAVEWECVSGPSVELLDTSSGRSRFALSDPTIDNRYLAWHPDGLSVYLKIGTLSVPQTLRVNVLNAKAVELPISPYTYDLAVSPDGRSVLFSLSRGIGSGSETWVIASEGQTPSMLLTNPQNITALAQYSPDGSKIAFIKIPDTQDATPTGELWLMNADGTQAQKIAGVDAGHGFFPVWSPDGTKIVYVGRQTPQDPNALNLSIITPATGSIISVAQTPLTQPGWSPSGAMVAFSSTGQARDDKMIVWLYDLQKEQPDPWLKHACCAGWIK